MTPAPLAAPHHRRTYDHRLREHVCRTGARALGHRLHVPRSTISSWKRRGLRAVVSHEVFDQDRQKLLSTVEKLERRARILAATVRLLLALLRASGFRLVGERLPKGATKASILRAITSAESALPLALILRILGMPPSRYHAWRRDKHNAKMPHAAFRGQTPDEVFFDTAPNLPVELDAARAKARELRLAANRSASCSRCAPAAGSEIPP